MWATTIKGQNTFVPTFSVLCVSFTLQMVKTHVIKLLGIEGPNTCDQIACHAFHSLLVEVQMNSGYIHAMQAR